MAKSNNTEGKGKKNEATEAASQEVAVVRVSANAIQKAVGPIVISLLSQADSDEAKVKELGKRSFQGRNEALARMTEAFLVAHKADGKFQPGHVFSETTKEKASALEMAQIVIGIKEVVDGNVQYTEAVRKHFPPSKPTKAFKESQKFKDLRAFQSNFVQRIRKACEASYAIEESGASGKYDETAKTLIVTNAPKQIAGPTGTAALSGAEVEGAQEKASIDAFRRLGAKLAGKAPAKGKATNGESLAQRALESEDAFGELCNSLIKAVNALEGTVSATQTKHLESVYLAIADALKLEAE